MLRRERNMKSNYLFVLNPVAGNADIENVSNQISELLDPTEHAYAVYQTTGNNDLESLRDITNEDQFHKIVGVGGDGTISMLIPIVHEQNAELGIIPAGTGNVLAKYLSIPLNLKKALANIIFSPESRQFDILKIGDYYTPSHASMGIYANMLHEASSDSKKSLGLLAYLKEAGKELLNNRRWDFTICVDGKEERLKSSLVLVANIPETGINTFKWGNNINPYDGKVELLSLDLDETKDYVDAIVQFLRGEPNDIAKVTYYNANRSIQIKCEEDIPVSAAGEIVGKGSVDMEICPHYIKVIVPT